MKPTRKLPSYPTTLQNWSLLGAIFLGVSLLMITAAPEQGKSLLRDTYREYLNEIATLRANGVAAKGGMTMAEFHRLWKERFNSALAKASDKDPGKAQVLHELMALQISLQDYEQAKTTAHQLYNQSTNPEYKQRILMDIAETEELEYRTFPQSIGFEQLEKSFRLALANAVPSSGLPIFKIVNFEHKLAGLLRSQKKYDEALDLYLQSLSTVEKASREDLNSIEAIREQSAGASSLSKEWILQNAMEAAFDARKDSQAMELYKRLESLQTKGAKSYYFYVMASHKDPDKKAIFQRLAEEWLATKPVDTWTLDLKYHLAVSYYSTMGYGNASRIFSQIVESSLPFRSPTPDRDAMSADALYFLASSLTNLGEKQEAIQLFETFKRRYPSDPRINFLKNLGPNRK